jgi:pyruvate dehydrogenase E1 component beta subunit
MRWPRKCARDDGLRDGRGSRGISGRLQGDQGLLEEFGRKRVIDTPITEHGFAGIGVGAAMGGLRPDCRIHDLQLRDAGDRPHHQLGREDQLHVGRPDALPDRVPWPQRRGERASGRSTARTMRPGMRHVPGLIVIAPYDGGRCEGPAEGRDPRPEPVVFLENELVYGRSFEVPDGRVHVVPIGKARSCARART